MVITSPLHGEGRRFEPGRKLFTFKQVLIHLLRPIVCPVAEKNQTNHPSFLSVVVITSPLHGEGRRFEPGRKLFTFKQVLIHLLRPIVCPVAEKNQTNHPSSLSVVVITSALHA